MTGLYLRSACAATRGTDHARRHRHAPRRDSRLGFCRALRPGGRDGWASTPSGRPRPGATTGSRRSPTWPARPRRSSSAPASSRAAPEPRRLVGMTAMTLQSMSGGRFMLGLGTSGPQVVEGWHGVPFAGAVSRLKETAEIVRMVCSGERLVYNGRHYTLPLPGGEGKAIRSGAPPTEPPGIYFASLGPNSLRMCGESRRRLAGHFVHPRDRRGVLRRHPRGRGICRTQPRRH